MLNDFFVQEFKDYLKTEGRFKLGRPFTVGEVKAINSLTILPELTGFTITCDSPSDAFDKMIEDMIDANVMAMFFRPKKGRWQ